MKNLLKIACIFAIMPGLVVACTNPAPDPDPLDAPAGLQVVTLTTTTASLSWQTVTDAEEYNVVIGEGAPVKVAATSYEASGLSAATTYKWKVQAVKGDAVSEWADGPDFTTEAETEVEREQFVHAEVYAHNGDYYGEGTENFTIDFCDYDPHGADLNGIRLTLDFIFGQELNMDPAKTILDLPAGTYGIDATKGVNTIYSKQSGVMEIVNGNDSGSYTMTEGGTMTIAGDHTGYTMTFDIILSGGGELHAEYTGPFEIANPYCLPPSK